MPAGPRTAGRINEPAIVTPVRVDTSRQTATAAAFPSDVIGQADGRATLTESCAGRGTIWRDADVTRHHFDIGWVSVFALFSI